MPIDGTSMDYACSLGLWSLGLTQLRSIGWQIYTAPGCCISKTALIEASKSAVPNLIGTRDWFCGKQFFPQTGRMGFGVMPMSSSR